MMGGFVFKEARRRIGKSGRRRERSWAVRPKRSPWMTYSVPVVLTMGLWVWSVYISEMSSCIMEVCVLSMPGHLGCIETWLGCVGARVSGVVAGMVIIPMNVG